MLKAVVLFLAVCSTLAALDSNTGESKPPASVGPAGQFGTADTPTTTTSTAATTTTTTANTTTTTTAPTTTTTTAPTTTTTTAPTTTTTTTPATTTTTAPTTTTTTAPTTTTKTAPTTTTTTAPTTTTKTAPTTTTTTTPANTTTPATTTPATTPSTNVTVGNYSLNKGKDTCLKAVMGLKIRLESKEANGTFIVQPLQTNTTGGCKETTANLTLVFPQGFITFMFNKSVADNLVYVDTLSFQLSYPFANGGFQPYKASNSTLQQFPARIGHAYSCKQESVYMGNGLYLDVIQDRMQAFNFTSNDFGTSDPCPADKPDYRVAIAVGVTLLVLIVVVVVVYLLGRRKRSDGYQSL